MSQAEGCAEMDYTRPGQHRDGTGDQQVVSGDLGYTPLGASDWQLNVLPLKKLYDMFHMLAVEGMGACVCKRRESWTLG